LILYPGLSSWATFRRPFGTQSYSFPVLSHTLQSYLRLAGGTIPFMRK
jgi:hypothetical protein